MKVITGRINELAQALSSASNTIPLEMNAGVKIALVAERVRIAVTERERRRHKKLDEYGELNEDGTLKVDKNNSAVFPAGGQLRYEAAMVLVDEEMVELECDPIPLTILSHRENGKPYKGDDGELVTILPSILLGIMPIIEDVNTDES